MSDQMQSEDSRKLTLEEANAEIERLRAQLAASDGDVSSREPIAVVGMGCRYPGGVKSPDEFWELLSSGRDVLREIPNERWDVDAYFDPEMTVPGKMYVRQGYYLDDIDQFDPQFFGLSPREAESLDPQQRLVMEVSWETLEHAGIAPSKLRGGKTGVFVGQYWDDYSSQRIYATDNREIDRYAQLSGLRGLTAGRICHILDSHGPAIQLDTACSSSSLAVHMACQSLRTGESDLALAGGVSLILAPEHLIGICQMTALSPDGRCKTFDANADGFGQGEGCGMIALKRLSDARADGNTILVPGYYDPIRPPSEEEVWVFNGSIADWPAREAAMKQSLAVDRWIDGMTGREAYAQMLFTTTLNIDGIYGGYTGVGVKTILPHKATAKMDSRLVPDQVERGVYQAFDVHPVGLRLPVGAEVAQVLHDLVDAIEARQAPRDEGVEVLAEKPDLVLFL